MLQVEVINVVPGEINQIFIPQYISLFPGVEILPGREKTETTKSCKINWPLWSNKLWRKALSKSCFQWCYKGHNTIKRLYWWFGFKYKISADNLADDNTLQDDKLG